MAEKMRDQMKRHQSLSIPIDTGHDTQVSKDQSIELLDSHQSVNVKLQNKKHKKFSKKIFIDSPKNLVFSAADDKVMLDDKTPKHYDGYHQDSSAPTHSRHDNYF